jgi:SSS family solute:Na+ symporter
LFGGLLKLPNLFLMIVPGMIAVILLPDLGNPDRVFPAITFELLPVGLRGLIITALLAAIMSSLDSALNAAASLLTMDFVRPLRPQTSDRALMTIGRAFTGFLILFAALYAPLIERFGSLFQYFQSTLAYLVPPIVAVYLGGLFSMRLSGSAAWWAIVSGLGIGVSLFVAKEATGIWGQVGLPDLHFTYMSLMIFLVALAVLVVVSMRTPAPQPASLGELTFGAGDLKALKRPAANGWHRDYRSYAVVLAALMIGLIAAFW